MSAESTSKFVSIDQIRREQTITPERLAEFHGVAMPVPVETGKEVRIACPFPNCGKQGPTGNKAIAVQQETCGFVWKCFQYGCHKGGNDVAFNDLLRDGLGDGRPRGPRFKENLADYQQMAGGVGRRTEVNVPPVPVTALQSGDEDESEENVPLENSDNESVRALVDLPNKFITNQGKMPPYAASYQRHRKWFLDPARVLEDWGVGYLPKGTKGERMGGTMRDKMVFPINDPDGKLLAYCGRDPDWEQKHAHWSSLSEERRSQEAEPPKWRFPSRKMFRKGRELFGQERVMAEGAERKLSEQGGLWVVEGPGDVINLSQADILSVALMWNGATPQQVVKLTRIAWDHAAGHIVPMFDLDDEGQKGMWRFMQEMAKHAYIRVAWNTGGGAEKWQGKQPEDLSITELNGVKERVVCTGK